MPKMKAKQNKKTKRKIVIFFRSFLETNNSNKHILKEGNIN